MGDEQTTADGRLWKFMSERGRTTHRNYAWPLPDGDAPGAWLPPVEGRLVACQRGYHLARTGDLLHWLAPTLYLAEYRGERLDADDKIVVREARLVRRVEAWDDRTARLWGADCAEHTLHLFEARCPDDPRPRQAIAMARRRATEAVPEEQWSAAESAAESAAWSAAWSAAELAARSAARSAAESAAWSAAESAAWSAAELAAELAARSAAWSAAESAARSAAWSAETAWQLARLLDYLDGRAG